MREYQMPNWKKPEAARIVPDHVAIARPWSWVLRQARSVARNGLSAFNVGDFVEMDAEIVIDEEIHELVLKFEHAGFQSGRPVARLVSVVDVTPDLARSAASPAIRAPAP